MADLDATRLREVSADAYREVMATVPTAISVLAARTPEGRPVGLLIQAVVSLSADPPRILVSVSESSRTLPHLLRCGFFSVNVLSHDGLELSSRFASRAEDKFAGVGWGSSGPGHDVPILTDGVSASIVCAIEEVLPRHDHSIIIGQVLEAQGSEREPLLYHARGFRQLASRSSG
ncbi:flavin reductase family protein [Longivirga aurantiaca]|uniref:Flavin reductase family protein n=1 Tax=Longivirga aurantiaca TaxID=1837743 RepID=A0ABW1SV88_9ACTN